MHSYYAVFMLISSMTKTMCFLYKIESKKKLLIEESNTTAKNYFNYLD